MIISSYALQYSNVSFPAIQASTLDLFITEGAPLAPTTSGRALTDAEVAALRSQGRTIIGYINVAATDDLRYYWQPAWTANGSDTGPLTASAPSWLQGSVLVDFTGDTVPDTRFVQFWDLAWQQIVIDQAIELVLRGYSGIFLDDVAAYFKLGFDLAPTASEREATIREYATRMAEFIGRIGAEVRAINPNAYIVANADPYFIANQMIGARGAAAAATYLGAVDAHLFENKEAADLNNGLPSFAGETILFLESDGTPGYTEAQARAAGTLYVAPLNYDALGVFAFPATSGDDVLRGGNGPNQFDLSAGGNDDVDGGPGNDVIVFGSQLTASDRINGGLGNDQVGISGNYAGSTALVFNATTLTNVEVLAALPGTGNIYNITTHDATVAAGATLTIFGGNLGTSQNLDVNASAETDGSIVTFGGLGRDRITGGALSDGFYFGPGKWQGTDFVIGGGGSNDQLALDGNYSITLGTAADVEVLVLLPGPASSPNTFAITFSDFWILPGATKTVFGRNVTTALTINGTAEASGNFVILAGRAGDTITGGGGNDLIFGLEGNDIINGRLGSDTVVYQGARASYSIVTNSGNVQIVDNDAVADGNDGTDTVLGIEFAQFSDQTISITSPIILDLDGGGVETISAAASNARFDMDGDGIGDDTSWFGRGEGLLFLDRDGNGTLSNVGEMSFTGDVANARSDLEGLSAFDSNGDGELSRRDARFADFKIWRDRNGDGVVDRREVMTLRQAGVRSLSLTGTANSGTYALGDTAVVNTGSFTRTNGRQGGLIDAVLTAVSSKAETDALAAMRDAVASDLGSTDTGLDPRIALMTQDMASFGATHAATETDRWRREGVPQFEMFAA